MKLRTILTIPPQIEALPLVQGVTRELALMAGFPPLRINAILLAAEEAFASIVARAARDTEQPVVLTGELVPLALVLTFHDQEAPSMPAEAPLPRLDASALDASDPDLTGLGRVLIQAAADEAFWQSLGREGNCLRLTFNRPQPDIVSCTAETLERFDREIPVAPEQEYRIRRAGGPEDWVQICRTVYRAYGYTHPSDDIYYPDRLRDLNQTGRLVSMVAMTAKGEVVGHYALELGGLGQVAARRCLVAETGMAVVDPAHRGRGLMERMREKLEATARDLGLHGLFGQPVTNHPFSQQVNEKFGSRPCALSLAFLAGNLRFRAMAREQSGQRESCLLYFKSLVPPKMRFIQPPPHHQAMLLETYRICCLPATVVEVAEPVAGESRVSAHYLASLDLGMIRIETVGPDLAQVLRHARNELIRRAGTRVLYLTVRLTHPGCAEACAVAEHLGFFYGGLAPYFDEGEDVLRMQYVDVSLDISRLVVVSEFGRKLAAYVAADRQRVER